jgi:hypothetical protein
VGERKSHWHKLLITRSIRLTLNPGIGIATRTGVKKLLACALLALGLTFNVEAQRTPPTYPAPIPSTGRFPVPDPGSTAVLLGIGLAALGGLGAVFRKKDQT